MDQRKRNIYVSFKQKKKLVELVAKQPQLLSSRGNPNFSFQDAQSIWQDISRQCNDIPGAKKTWRQWKKTWQDLRSKYKKKPINSKRPTHLSFVLTSEEKEVLGMTATDVEDSSYQEATEFVLLDQIEENNFDSTVNENDSLDNLSDTKPESPTDNHVNELKDKKNTKHLKNSKHQNCYFNCNTLAEQEQRKIQIKEDYLNFKKEYLRQKLKLLKEQTEALKSIAKELCDK